MTHRQTISTLVAALVSLALLAAVAGTGAATQADDEPAIRITDGTATDGGNTSVDVVLTSAPNGLAGYYLDLAVESPDGARLVEVDYPEQFGLTTTPTYSDDGTTVTVEAADLDDAVEPGATDVRLATVEIAGATPDELSLAAEPRQFDDDEGTTFQPAQATGETATAASTPATTVGAPSSTDGQGTATASATGGNGPLSPALVVGAVALLTGVGLRRRGT